MGNGRTAIVTDQGDLFTVRIDPTWRYRSLWQSPIGDKLSVMFMDLDGGISEQASVNYADATVIGRAEGLKTYMQTGNREVTLVFKFRAQGLSGGDSDMRVGGTNLSALSAPQLVNGDGVQSRDATSGLYAQLDREVMQPAKFLDALKFPLLTEQGLSVNPPRVLLTIGRLLTMPCIVTASQLTWEGPFDPETMAPYGATVSVTFTSVAGRVTAYNFDGPNRWAGASDSTVLVGIDGPANPFSNLGSGISGTDNSGSAQA